MRDGEEQKPQRRPGKKAKGESSPAKCEGGKKEGGKVRKVLITK